MKKLIKIYGERNTNSNYLSQLIKLNLQTSELRGVVPAYINLAQQALPFNREALRDFYFSRTYKNNLGWKHQAAENPNDLFAHPGICSGRIKLVTITKNPYSWLLSFHRSPHHQQGSKKNSFITFLQKPLQSLGREGTNKRKLTPIQLWNTKNESYHNLQSDNCLTLTSESLFKSPNKVIQHISDTFQIRRLQPAFIDHEKSTKDPKKDSAYYRNYYNNELWRELLSPEALDIINANIDTKLMRKFNYTVILHDHLS